MRGHSSNTYYKDLIASMGSVQKRKDSLKEKNVKGQKQAVNLADKNT